MSTGAAIGLVCVIPTAAIVYLLAASWTDDGPGEEQPPQPAPDSRDSPADPETHSGKGPGQIGRN